MKVGFTGTQRGMTPEQGETMFRLLRALGATELHHGDCVGADDESHHVARKLGLRVVLHPPEDGRKRAWKMGDEEREPKPYLVRNRDIVDETDVLVATPHEAAEVLRSGTWATIRYAARKGKRYVIIKPDGSRREQVAR